MQDQSSSVAGYGEGVHDLLLRWGVLAGDHDGLAKAYQRIGAYHVDVIERLVEHHSVTHETRKRLRQVSGLQDRLEHLLLIERYVVDNRFADALKVARAYKRLATGGGSTQVFGGDDGEKQPSTWSSVLGFRSHADKLIAALEVEQAAAQAVVTEGQAVSAVRTAGDHRANLTHIEKAKNILYQTARVEMNETACLLMQHDNLVMTHGRAYRGNRDAWYSLRTEEASTRSTVAPNEGFVRFLERRVAVCSKLQFTREGSQGEVRYDFIMDHDDERAQMALACAKALEASASSQAETSLLQTYQQALDEQESSSDTADQRDVSQSSWAQRAYGLTNAPIAKKAINHGRKTQQGEESSASSLGRLVVALVAFSKCMLVQTVFGLLGFWDGAVEAWMGEGDARSSSHSSVASEENGSRPIESSARFRIYRPWFIWAYGSPGDKIAVNNSEDWREGCRQQISRRRYKNLPRQALFYGFCYYVAYWLTRFVDGILIGVRLLGAAIAETPSILRGFWQLCFEDSGPQDQSEVLRVNQVDFRHYSVEVKDNGVAEAAGPSSGAGEAIAADSSRSSSPPTIVTSRPDYHAHSPSVFNQIIDSVLMEPMHVFGRLYHREPLQAAANTVGLAFGFPVLFTTLPIAVQTALLTIGKAIAASGVEMAGTTTAANVVMLGLDGVMHGQDSLLYHLVEDVIQHPDKALALAGMVAAAAVTAPMTPIWPMIRGEAGNVPAIATVLVYAKGGFLAYHLVASHGAPAVVAYELSSQCWNSPRINLKHEAILSVWERGLPTTFRGIGAKMAQEEACYQAMVAAQAAQVGSDSSRRPWVTLMISSAMMRRHLHSHLLTRLIVVLLAPFWGLFKIIVLAGASLLTGLCRGMAWLLGNEVGRPLSQVLNTLLIRQIFLFGYDCMNLGFQVFSLGRIVGEVIFGLATFVYGSLSVVPWLLDGLIDLCVGKTQSWLSRGFFGAYHGFDEMVDQASCCLARASGYQTVFDALDANPGRHWSLGDQGLVDVQEDGDAASLTCS